VDGELIALEVIDQQDAKTVIEIKLSKPAKQQLPHY
jgi:hypothetical protein